MSSQSHILQVWIEKLMRKSPQDFVEIVKACMPLMPRLNSLLEVVWAELYEVDGRFAQACIDLIGIKTFAKFAIKPTGQTSPDDMRLAIDLSGKFTLLSLKIRSMAKQPTNDRQSF